MRLWKLLLGIGGACAACCALPLVGGTAAVAALSGALMTCADGFVPLVGSALVFATGIAGLWWWRRRAMRSAAACGCTAPSDAAVGPCCPGEVHASR